MNSYFNRWIAKVCLKSLVSALVLIFILIAGERSHAVVIYGIHISSCERFLGVILNVEPLEIEFLTLAGQVKKIKRYEIINVSYYESSYLPLAVDTEVKTLPSYIIETRRGNEIVELLRGWPVDFNNDKISFISSDGLDILINRDNIWNIIEEYGNGKISKPQNNSTGFKFYPPYQFRECELRETYPSANADKTIILYPQQTLSEPITIKKEFDRLYQGYESIHRYLNEKQFYGVPQIYGNLATLGVWLNSGSRYGSSNSRTSNLLPFIVNEKSTGPYSYQHKMVTGVAPLRNLSHEEPQSQFSYQFKASYFHLMGMLDPNQILVGDNYKWQTNDFTDNDIKVNDSTAFELGFDYDKFSIASGSRSLNWGLLFDNYFTNGDAAANVMSFTYHNHLFRAECLSGSNNSLIETRELTKGNNITYVENSFDFKFTRLNLDLTILEKWLLAYSYISKDINLGDLIQTSSQSHAMYLSYKYKRYLIGAFTALESQTVKTINSAEAKYNHPKFGASVSLRF